MFFRKKEKKGITIKEFENIISKLKEAHLSTSMLVKGYDCDFSGWDRKEIYFENSVKYFTDDLKKIITKNGTYKTNKNNIYLIESVPLSYWHNNSSYYSYYCGHWNGNFFKLTKNENAFTIEAVEEKDCKGEKIWDFCHSETVYNLGETVEDIIKYWYDYLEEHSYTKNRSKYIKTEYVDKMIPNSNYSSEYSMSKEDEEKMNNWRKEHLDKFHNGKVESHGATPVDNFTVEYCITGLGTYCICKCSRCYNKYLEAKQKSPSQKELTKMYNDAVYTIKEIG